MTVFKMQQDRIQNYCQKFWVFMRFFIRAVKDLSLLLLLHSKSTHINQGNAGCNKGKKLILSKSLHIELGNASYSKGEIHQNLIQTKSTHIELRNARYSTGEIHQNLIQTYSHETARIQKLNSVRKNKKYTKYMDNLSVLTFLTSQISLALIARRK